MPSAFERAFIQRFEGLHLLDGALHAFVGAVEEHDVAFAVLGDVFHAVEPHGEEHEAGRHFTGLHGFASVGETFGDLLAEAGIAGTFKLGGFFFGFGFDADGAGFGLGCAGFDEVLGLSFVFGGGLHVVAGNDLRHGAHDGFIEGDVVDLKVEKVVAPAVERFFEVILHGADDLGAEDEDFGLLFVRHIGANAAFDTADEGLHEALFVDEAEGDLLDGLLTSVLRGVNDERFEVYVGLVERDGFEFELDGLVLRGDAFIDTLKQWQLEVEAWQHEALVFAKAGDDSHMPLFDDGGAEEDENNEDDGGGDHGTWFCWMFFGKAMGGDEIRRGIRRSGVQG